MGIGGNPPSLQQAVGTILNPSTTIVPSRTGCNIIELYASATELCISSLIIRLHQFLVSVSVSDQYQHFLVVLESVRYVIQVPIPLLCKVIT